MFHNQGWTISLFSSFIFVQLLDGYSFLLLRLDVWILCHACWPKLSEEQPLFTLWSGCDFPRPSPTTPTTLVVFAILASCTPRSLENVFAAVEGVWTYSAQIIDRTWRWKPRSTFRDLVPFRWSSCGCAASLRHLEWNSTSMVSYSRRFYSQS